MSVVIKVKDTAFSDTSIPVLNRDALMNNNAGLKASFDALDAYSFSKQAAPTAGSDVWKNLADDGATSASFVGTVGFSSGFVLSAATTNEYIKLPTGVKPGASDNGAMFIFWMKRGASMPTSGFGVFAALSDSNANELFKIVEQYSATAPVMSIYALNNQVVTSGGMAGNVSPLQIGLSFEKQGGGTYNVKAFLNGQKLGSTLAAANTSLPTVTDTLNIGYSANSNYSRNWDGTVFRAVYDNLSVLTPEALAAADYALNKGRFA